MGWNGDVRRAIVSLAKKDREMVYLVPDGPTEYWVDNWVIPADSEHPVAAHKWIDYVLEPVNAGKEMNYHQYPVPVTGIKGVDAEARQRPGDQRPGREDPGLRVPDRDGQRACSSATAPTRSSRPPDDGGGRRHVRAPCPRPRVRAAASSARSPGS